jgi:hypothetical protein
MPVERCLVKETIVSDTNWIDDAMYNCNDNKDTVLPVNTRTFIGVTNINKRGNKLGKTQISRSNSNYVKKKMC